MRGLCILAMMWLAAGQAQGRLRPPVYDAELIGSELIIIARLDPKAIRHRNRGADARLITAETLKGTPPGKTVEVRIHDFAIVGGYYKGADGRTIDLRHGRRDYPRDKIVLYSDTTSLPAPQRDASGKLIWFLRRSRDGARYEVPAAEFAQPLQLRPYFAALLSPRPDQDLLKLLRGKDEEIRLRALTFMMQRHRPEDIACIAPLLDDPSTEVRSGAAEAAFEVADRSAALIFLRALTHGDPKVRGLAAAFLCRFREVQSLPLIARSLEGLRAREKRLVVSYLARMRSRWAVPALLEQLDEQPTPAAPTQTWAYGISAAAAAALVELTGVQFPLDAVEARRMWGDLKAHPPEVLLRKRIQADIKDLTHADYDVRWAAYRRLGKLVNRHFGSYNAFHGHEDAAGRAASQKLWRGWAAKNLTKTRLDWICAGFAASGIDLPRPMTNAGIETLVEVVEYYQNRGKRGREGGPLKWKVHGWAQADFHIHNANMLLERFTGHVVGLSPYHADLKMTWRRADVLARRWERWWRESRHAVKLRPWAGEKAVTKDILAKAPDLRALAGPVKLTIRPKSPSFHPAEPVVVVVTVKNVSPGPVTIAKRPHGRRYFCRTEGSSAQGGWPNHAEAGSKAEHYVALKPGQALQWEEAKAGGYRLGSPPPQRQSYREAIRFELTYPFAGSQFALRAWRGQLKSNWAHYIIETKGE